MAAQAAKFSVLSARVGLGIYSVILILIGIGGAGAQNSSGKIFGSALVLFGMLLSWRAFAGYTLVLRARELRYTTIVRRYSIEWSDIVNVRVDRGRVGLYEREYIVLRLAGGEELAMKSLSGPLKDDPSRPTIVYRAYSGIMKELAAHRSAGPEGRQTC